jgi:3-oxoacyl-[acyl-carrier-protein] synthase-3
MRKSLKNCHFIKIYLMAAIWWMMRFNMTSSVIIGCGSYLPEKIVTNFDLAKTVDTSDEWIVSRTGIKQRHIAAEDEFTSHMSANAAREAIKRAGISASDIDLIIVATTTPDRTFPSTAVNVQALLGINSGAAFDVQAVCSGFVYALSIADNFIKAGQCKTVLVIGADKMSCIVDWSDRNTCVLFGDGAGAVILQASEEQDRGIISTNLYSDGSLQDILNTDGGAGFSGTVGKVKMQGQEVFKHAVEKMSSSVKTALKNAGLGIADVAAFIPHQANSRILEMVAKKLRISDDKVISTVDMHANTSAASIPLALADADGKGRFKQGDLVVFTALGGGLTWGSCLLRW